MNANKYIFPMKKLLTLLLGMVWGLFYVSAQETSLPLHPEIGATWHYKELTQSIDWGTYPYDRFGFTKVTIEKETVVDGQKVFEVSFKTYTDDTETPSKTDIRYWFFEGGKAYELRKMSNNDGTVTYQRLLRYDLDANVGDTLIEVTGGGNTRKITVVNKETVEIDGKKLIKQTYRFHTGERTLDADLLQFVGLIPKSQEGLEGDISMDDIVDFKLHDTFMHKMAADPYTPTSFRCYSDGRISYQLSTEKCDYITPAYPRKCEAFANKGAVWYYENPSGIGYTKAEVIKEEWTPYFKYKKSKVIRNEVFEKSAVTPDLVFEQKIEGTTYGVAYLVGQATLYPLINLANTTVGSPIASSKEKVQDPTTGKEREVELTITLQSAKMVVINGRELQQQVYHFRLDNQKDQPKEWDATILEQIGVLPNPGNAMYKELQAMAEGTEKIQQQLSYYARGALRCFQSEDFTYKSAGIDKCQKPTSIEQPLEENTSLNLFYKEGAIYWSESSLASITLYDVEGAVILQSNVARGVHSLEATQLSRGTYVYLAVDTWGRRYAGKIVVL